MIPKMKAQSTGGASLAGLLFKMLLWDLFHETFEHGEQFPQLALAFLGAVRAFNAMVKVIVNDQLSERFQGFAGRHDLSQDVGTILVFSHHPLDRADLPRDFSQTELESFLLLFRVLVRFGCHQEFIAG